MYIYIKRIMDLCLSIMMLIVASPIMICAAIAIKLESQGPVIFKQKRPGKDERVFIIRKFRTMKVVTHKSGKSLSDHQRMTHVGRVLRKLSIDELPQLFNIIKGEMSFIGPRPLLVDYLKYYTPEERRRHDVLPGISGWAQVNGRNSISWEEKFTYDLWYVDHMAFSTDMKILVLTVMNILKTKDINHTNQDTMPIFKR